MILFCHITTKLNSDPDQALLSEKSSRVAFPTLLFLDQEGEVLARQGERSVAAFTKSVHALELIKRLEKPAANGDKSAKAALFMAKLDLGKFDFKSAKVASASLKLNAQQRKALDSSLVNLEVDQIYAEARKNRSYGELPAKFLAMKNAGRIPTSKYPTLRFWTQIMNLAQKNRDAKLYEEAMKAYHVAAGNSETYKRIRARHDSILDALQNGKEIPVPTRRRAVRLLPSSAKKAKQVKKKAPVRRK